MDQLPQEIIYKRKQEIHNKLLKITETRHQEFLNEKEFNKEKYG